MERTGRTSICSIVFLDIIGYSKEHDARQMAMKARLNEIIATAVSGVVEDERMILDTGDGAAICFVGDPEDALFAATAISHAVRNETGGSSQRLRIGINLGPVKMVTDLGGHPNVVGDGINVAQRIMSFADDDEILVSRSYYEVVARLQEGNEKLFRYLGVKKDKHVREHQIYVLTSGSSANLRPAPSGATSVGAEEIPGAKEAVAEFLSPALIDAETARLAERVGPMAKVIVRRAVDSASDIVSFYQKIAAVIPDAADRAAFFANAPIPMVEATYEEVSAAGSREPVAEAEIALAERILARHLGPLAKVLVRRTIPDAVDRDDLYRRLAESLVDDHHRRQFLAEARLSDR